MSECDDFMTSLDAVLDSTYTLSCRSTEKDSDIFLFLSSLAKDCTEIDFAGYDVAMHIENSSLPDTNWFHGTTSLMYALHIGNERAALALINWVHARGNTAVASILGKQDNMGMSALMLSARYGFLDAVRALVQHEACLQTQPEPHIKHSGTRPSSWVSGKTALMFAVEAGHVDIALLLVEHEAGIFSTLETHTRNTNRTKTVTFKHMFALDIVESDAARCAKTNQLTTALSLDAWMRAALTGDVQMLGSMAKSFAGRRNGLGQTATMIACYKDQAASIRTLMRHSPEQFRARELSCSDIFGNRALCYAVLSKAMACIAVLSAYDEAFILESTPCKHDNRDIAARWNGKNVCSYLDYAQKISLVAAYPFLSLPLSQSDVHPVMQQIEK